MEARGTSPSLPKKHVTKEGLSVWETECHMDVELFLEGQARWEMDSPHHLVILHTMFQHTSEQGWKETEHMICWGHWHGLLKLDPKVDIPAIQLVEPQTSREEFKPYIMRYTNSGGYWGLHQRARTGGRGVVLLRRLPGVERGKMLQMTGEPNPTNVQPLRSRTPRRGRRGCLHGKEPCWGKKSPLEGYGYGSHLGRKK